MNHAEEDRRCVFLLLHIRALARSLRICLASKLLSIIPFFNNEDEDNSGFTVHGKSHVSLV